MARQAAPASISETPDSSVAAEHVTAEENADENTAAVAGPFVGRWNTLVSTTNWEKGRIICQWREALIEAGTAVTDYSDESWAQLVGGVTSQHVGRLRRVFQRFGEVHEQYAGLYWSHFQAALDWDDAEMWLEGAIRNEWSVSQMRGSRWETLGTPPSEQVAELAAAEEALPAPGGEMAGARAAVTPQTATINDVGNAEGDSSQGGAAESDSSASAKPSEQASSAEGKSTGASGAESAPQPKPRRLKVNVESLPDDVADAFEQFKLAIIHHRREGWQETTQESVLECLDALRELVD